MLPTGTMPLYKMLKLLAMLQRYTAETKTVPGVPHPAVEPTVIVLLVTDTIVWMVFGVSSGLIFRPAVKPVVEET